jgi:acyl carrier protein
LEDKIKNLFAAVLQVNETEINDATTRYSIKTWTSMNHLALIAAFEEEFEIEIEPEEIPLMIENFGRFKTIILEKLKEGNQ